MAMVLRQGMAPVFTGIAAGLIAALAMGKFLASELFSVSPRDRVTMSAVTIPLLIVAACACLVPARRATRVDPSRALRFE